MPPQEVAQIVRVLTEVDRQEIATLLERNTFFWLDLTGPSETEINSLGELLQLHPVALEELREFGQVRSKLHPYGSYILLVYFGAGRDDPLQTDGKPALLETHLLVSGRWVITIHPQRCEEFVDLRRSFNRGVAGSEEFVVYRVLDTLTDTFFPLLSRIGDRIDALEERVMEEATNEELHGIRALKRELVTLRTVVDSQRDLFNLITDEIDTMPGLDQDAQNYFRNVYDHLIRISEEIKDHRELLSGVRDIYVSTVSNRLNEIMKRLTIVATIFLPLTFVTGFFGQNFGWLTDNLGSVQAFMSLGLGLLLVSLVAFWVWFKRSRFL